MPGCCKIIIIQVTISVIILLLFLVGCYVLRTLSCNVSSPLALTMTTSTSNPTKVVSPLNHLGMDDTCGQNRTVLGNWFVNC